jgi:hypothetical protein
MAINNNLINYPIRGIKDRVISDLGLGLFDNFFNLFDNDSKKGPYIFRDIVKQAIIEYSRYFPPELHFYLNNIREMSFTDNSQQVIQGVVSPDNLMLIPSGISRIGWRFTAAYWWRYDAPILRGYQGNFLYGPCYYFAPFPYVLELADDGDFTEDSAIYLLEIGKDNYFLVFLDLLVAERIKRIKDSVNISSLIEILPNIDSTISDLKEHKDTLLHSISKIFRMWRK